MGRPGCGTWGSCSADSVIAQSSPAKGHGRWQGAAWLQNMAVSPCIPARLHCRAALPALARTGLASPCPGAPACRVGTVTQPRPSQYLHEHSQRCGAQLSRLYQCSAWLLPEN